MVYIYNGILLSHKEEWSAAICKNMDGLGGYYAKWNKSESETQILFDLILSKWYVDPEKKEKNKFIEKEIRLVVTRNRVWGQRELDEGSQKVQTSSYKINKY